MDDRVRAALDDLERRGLTAPALHACAKAVGRDHRLAQALWKTGRRDARMLAPLVDEPSKVTSSQMDRWSRDFDSWGLCDCACCYLFDKTPYAYAKPAVWASSEREFVKRAAFALIACLAVHDKKAPDASFRKFFPLIATHANDERNFVKKGVSWALRGIGKRNPKLRAEALKLAEKLTTSKDASARWIGRDAIRDLSR